MSIIETGFKAVNIIFGVDTHKSTHVAVAINEQGVRLAAITKYHDPDRYSYNSDSPHHFPDPNDGPDPSADGRGDPTTAPMRRTLRALAMSAQIPGPLLPRAIPMPKIGRGLGAAAMAAAGIAEMTPALAIEMNRAGLAGHLSFLT